MLKSMASPWGDEKYSEIASGDTAQLSEYARIH